MIEMLVFGERREQTRQSAPTQSVVGKHPFHDGVVGECAGQGVRYATDVGTSGRPGLNFTHAASLPELRAETGVSPYRLPRKREVPPGRLAGKASRLG